MNERHEQLMAQAWIEFAPDAKAVTKRFAELIVDAVYDHILDATMYDNPFPFREDVKKHFGVEE